MRNLRCEDEIVENWMGEKPLVSICFITYNQDQYIEDAFESFLNQKTDFPFEIIVHDDASTDKTRNIINEYYNRYPNIIRCIFQDDNQYGSRGFGFIKDVFKEARGEYIAVCEGDDYWIDTNKINVQFEALERTGIDICFTKGRQIDSLGNITEISDYGDEEKVFSLSDVIVGRGGFMPTASLFLRKTSLLLNMPEGFYSDHYIQMISSYLSGALYIPKTTCLYRYQSKGSWSSTAFLTEVQERNLGIAVKKLYEFQEVIGLCENKAFRRLLYLYLRQYVFLPKLEFSKKLKFINQNSDGLTFFDKVKLILISVVPYSNVMKEYLLKCIRK